MSDSVVLLQPAFVVRHINYRESSLILDVLTRDFGLVSLLAKGVRKKKSAWAGVLLPFAYLKLSYQGRSELKLLTGAELAAPHSLSGIPLFCGFYLNELVGHFLYKHDPHPEVFELYRRCLKQLENSETVEQTLRMFELKLMAYAGYAVSLTHQGDDGVSVAQDKWYRYQAGIGVIADRNGYIRGDTLLSLHNEKMLSPSALIEAKRFIRVVLDDHLQGKELKSRAVLAKVIKYLQ